MTQREAIPVSQGDETRRSAIAARALRGEANRLLKLSRARHNNGRENMRRRFDLRVQARECADLAERLERAEYTVALARPDTNYVR